MSGIERPGVRERRRRTAGSFATTGRVACAAMVVAAAGLVASALLGGPLLSILLAGLLLLCPVLLWAPFHNRDRSFDRLPSAGRDDD